MTEDPTYYLDPSKPFVNLGPDRVADYVWQRGRIYCWSESNISYEKCWWLTSEGDPIQHPSPYTAEHVKNLLRDRPFDKQWLEVVKQV